MTATCWARDERRQVLDVRDGITRERADVGPKRPLQLSLPEHGDADDALVRVDADIRLLDTGVRHVVEAVPEVDR
jgi:hypothetical protein